MFCYYFSASIVVGLVENVGAAAALYLRASRDRVALTCIIHQSKATIAWLSLTDNPPKTLFALSCCSLLLLLLFRVLRPDTRKKEKNLSKIHKLKIFAAIDAL